MVQTPVPAKSHYKDIWTGVFHAAKAASQGAIMREFWA